MPFCLPYPLTNINVTRRASVDSFGHRERNWTPPASNGVKLTYEPCGKLSTTSPICCISFSALLVRTTPGFSL
jgi:hypothetical protein